MDERQINRIILGENARQQRYTGILIRVGQMIRKRNGEDDPSMVNTSQPTIKPFPNSRTL